MMIVTRTAVKYWLYTECESGCLPSTSQSVEIDPASPASQSEPEREKRVEELLALQLNDFIAFNKTW